jgi:hypothetical protein
MSLRRLLKPRHPLILRVSREVERDEEEVELSDPAFV